MSSSRLAAVLAASAALVLVAGAVPAAAKKPDAAPAAATPTVDPKNISKGVRAPLVEAQKLEAAGDLPGALAQVRIAEGAGNLNSTDTFFIAQMKLGIASKTKDNALMAEALKAAVNSEFLPATEKPKYIRNLASIALQANDYATATTYYEQLAALTPNDPEVLTNLSVLYSRQKQYPEAIATLKKAIAADKAAGKPADENLYRTELKIAVDAKMPAEAQTAGMDLIAAYPNPVNWRDVLLLFRDSQKLDDQGSLDVLRLMDVTGALAGEADYNEYVELAITKGLPAEAKAVLAEGIDKKMVTSTKTYVIDQNKSIATRLAADKAGMAAADKDARAAANGKIAVGQGDAYYGYGEYAKSAEMYRLALSKGGVDPATVNLRLGAALARGGDKAAATTAFQAVSGGPRAVLAQYWLLWLAHQG
jgi:tetratricopeptide (TPR) repeat protein